MKNRITNHDTKSKDIEELKTFFLACEFKPNSPLFSVLDPFAYNIQPAFINGSLGIISYEPNTYAVIDTDEGGQPLLGYIITLSEPDTIELLHKLKGCLGSGAFNTHQKNLVQAYTEVGTSQPAWVFQLSEYVLENYQQIEQVEFGMWDEEDDAQIDFLEKIGEAL